MVCTLSCLSRNPDLLLIDGQGLAHPRHIGLACHIGVLADIPTIGAAKSHLVGHYHEPAENRGAWSRLTHDGRVVGAVLRTRTSVKPLFVSTGHRISLKTAITVVLEYPSRRFAVPPKSNTLLPREVTT
jgi:deoxyribonuclease V